ncbi:MAG: hypothetical protein ABL958_02370 [Bdellovibrionia bacterium]
MVRWTQINVCTVLVALLVLSGCSVRRLESNNSGSSQPTPPPSAAVVTSFSVDQYNSCWAAPLVIDTLTNCLSAKSAIPATQVVAFRQAVTTCVSANEAGNSSFLAICLESKSFIVRGRRLPYQSDFASCSTAAGMTGIAGCLDKRGILPAAMSQANIDGCVAQNGGTITNLERCLRTGGSIPKKTVLNQFDISLCAKISGGAANVHACLLDNQLIPIANNVPSILAADIDTCVTTATITGVAACLRTNLKIRRNLQQAHIDACIDAVGVGGVTACLTSNGLLPTNAGTPLVQADVDSCASAVGAGSLASCFRARGFLNKVLSQADIADCTQFAGATGIDVQRCLNTNGILPAGVAAAQIDTCITNVAATPGLTVTKCLRGQNFLSKALMQADVNVCNRLVGQAGIAACLNANFTLDTAVTQAQIDTCVTNVTLPSVARCLKTNSVVPQILLQPHVNSCLANAGQANLVTCLTANGFVDPAPVAPLVLITQMMADTCNSNVGPSNIARCIAANDGVTRTLAQVHFTGCNSFAGSAGILACLTNNGLTIPATLTQAGIDTCVATAGVGVANVVTCLQTAGQLP